MMLGFTCGEKKNLRNHQKVSRYYEHDGSSLWLLSILSKILMTSSNPQSFSASFFLCLVNEDVD